MSQFESQFEPIVVKPQPLHVPTYVYNTLRSFVESSTKLYHYNIGIIRDSIVTFEKPGKWRLTIELPRRVAVLSARGARVEFVPEPTCYEVALNEHKLCVNAREAKEYDIVPEEEVPYAKPINLSKVIDKMLLYVDVAVEAYYETYYEEGAQQ
jgi:hypothetical protein